MFVTNVGKKKKKVVRGPRINFHDNKITGGDPSEFTLIILLIEDFRVLFFLFVFFNPRLVKDNIVM